jgi:hypothetical protein
MIDPYGKSGNEKALAVGEGFAKNVAWCCALRHAKSSPDR